MDWSIKQGDCRQVLQGMPADSVDSVITDPPYGLGFMGKEWDHDVPGVEYWVQALRVAKPGAHMLVFGGTRKFHRMACAIEDAGWEIRDTIMWVYGSGFPKSLDVSKAIDKAAGVERTEVVGVRHRNVKPYDDGNGWNANATTGDHAYTAPASDLAKTWAGWGTALKPAYEPIIVARKPLIGTVVENVQKYGTGVMNIDECRVRSNGDKLGGGHTSSKAEGWDRPWKHNPEAVASNAERSRRAVVKAELQGRWPANLIHDGSDEVLACFPVTGPSKATPRNNGEFKSVAKGRDLPHVAHGHEDSGGSAARFFYCAKASKADRGEDNKHPTVKPTELMRYLCRMVTQKGGVILDPFAGSGSTGKAAVADGFKFIGIELQPEYVRLSEARIRLAKPEHAATLFDVGER